MLTYEDILSKNEDIVRLCEADQWDEAFELLKDRRPYVLNVVMRAYFERSGNDGEYLDEHLTQEQRDTLRWLDSSKRCIEYYENNVPEDEMTEEDWADFRAAAW